MNRESSRSHCVFTCVIESQVCQQPLKCWGHFCNERSIFAKKICAFWSLTKLVNLLQWECDSMINFRFGRLNLVDLAGSERYGGLHLIIVWCYGYFIVGRCCKILWLLNFRMVLHTSGRNEFSEEIIAMCSHHIGSDSRKSRIEITFWHAKWWTWNSPYGMEQTEGHRCWWGKVARSGQYQQVVVYPWVSFL